MVAWRFLMQSEGSQDTDIVQWFPPSAFAEISPQVPEPYHNIWYCRLFKTLKLLYIYYYIYIIIVQNQLHCSGKTLTIFSLNFCQIISSRNYSILQIGFVFQILCWVEHFLGCVAGSPLVAHKTNSLKMKNRWLCNHHISFCVCFMFPLQTELKIFWL